MVGVDKGPRRLLLVVDTGPQKPFTITGGKFGDIFYLVMDGSVGSEIVQMFVHTEFFFHQPSLLSQPAQRKHSV